MAEVLLTADAKDDIRDLDGSARKIVLRAINKLKDRPEQRGQPLGNRRGTSPVTFRKLVVGDRDHRVVYRVEADGRVAVVWVVGPRADGEVYDMAMAMARLRLRGGEVAQHVTETLAQLWER